MLTGFFESIHVNAQIVSKNIALIKPLGINTQVFSYTGAIQQFIVPNRVTSIQVNAIGAKGGTGGNGQPGGAGGNITTTLNVTPGQVLYIVVGGYPGQSATAKYGFGGNGGVTNIATYYGGAGGGLSGVFTSSSPAVSNALVVAGGGGGGAGHATGTDYSGGNAGNNATGTSNDGNEAPLPKSSYVTSGRTQVGYAATTSAAGVAGYAFDDFANNTGTSGNDIIGGKGGGSGNWLGGGGGGAGYYGGGGGAGGGDANGGGAGGATKTTSGFNSFGILNTTGDGSLSITCLYNSGLVFQLDASNSSSYSASSGSVWNDLVGTNNATLFNTPSFNSPSIGLTFNGSSQYGSIPSVSGITDFKNTQQYSVEIWFNPSSGQATVGEAELLEKWNKNNESRYPFTIRYNESTSSMTAACYDGSTYLPATISGFPVNTWKQIVAVYDFVSKTLTVYRDGVSAGSASLNNINQVSNTSPIAIATRLQSTGAAQTNIIFKGTIGIIRIYNIALTAPQVQQNFNANKTRFGL